MSDPLADPLADPVRLRFAAALAVLVAIIFAAYWPTLSNELVWDDRSNLLENEHYEGLTGNTVRWAFTSAHVGHYQPLTWVSFGLDDVFWDGDPRGYHLTNIVLHALNAVLFTLVAFNLLVATLGDRATAAAGAVLAAAFFALHPLRVESVAWATQRRDVLCGAFFLLALWWYLLAVRRGRAGRLHTGFYIAAVGAFALSLLGKALGLMLPFALLVIDLYPLRRRPEASWLRLGLEKTPFLALSILSALAAIVAQSESGALASTEAHGVLARIAQAMYGLAFYVRATILSWEWYPLQEMPWPLNPFAPSFVISALLVIGTTVALFVFRRRWPGALAAWVAYGLLVAPVLGFAQSGSQLVADRYTYLACLGWAVLAGGLVARWWSALRPGDTRRFAVAAGVALVVLACSVLTWRQTFVWRTEETLWAHVVRGGPPSSLAHNNLGVIEARAGNGHAAILHFGQSLGIAPTYARARRNLLEHLRTGYGDLDASELGRVTTALRRSLDTVAGEDALAWYVLGLSSLRLNDPAQAAHDLERATHAQPDAGGIWRALARARAAAGDTGAAIEAAERAIDINPTDARAHELLRTLRGR